WTMQYYIAAIDYPINVGGRPLYSWPAFVPILFELTVLLAALAAFFGTLFLCGFPKLHFPTFNLAEFARASTDRFFLCIQARDPLHTGMANGAFLDTVPMPVTVDFLHRGEDRFNIFCSPCHSRTGDGDGMIHRRGFWIPPSFHNARLRTVPPGYIFQVINNGF